MPFTEEEQKAITATKDNILALLGKGQLDVASPAEVYQKTDAKLCCMIGGLNQDQKKLIQLAKEVLKQVKCQYPQLSVEEYGYF